MKAKLGEGHEVTHSLVVLSPYNSWLFDELLLQRLVQRLVKLSPQVLLGQLAGFVTHILVTGLPHVPAEQTGTQVRLIDS